MRRTHEAGRHDRSGPRRHADGQRATVATISGAALYLDHERRTVAHAVHGGDPAAALYRAGRGWFRAADRVRERSEPAAGARECEKKRDRVAGWTGREPLA